MLRFLLGWNCSTSGSFLSLESHFAHMIENSKETFLNADQPDLTTFSTSWIIEPMKHSASSAARRSRKKDRASSILCPAIASNSSQRSASVPALESKDKGIVKSRTFKVLATGERIHEAPLNDEADQSQMINGVFQVTWHSAIIIEHSLLRTGRDASRLF